MAKQVGIFKFEGKLGKEVSYMLNTKEVTRTIGAVDLVKMQTAPQYEETRKNQSEFAIATKAGQLFRQAMIDTTKGYTDYAYASDVVSLMLHTLRSDDKQPKGQKQLNNGLNNREAKLAFRRLNIYSKKSCRHYKGSLLQSTSSPNEYQLFLNALWSKANDGDQKTIKLGYLHIDFEGRVAQYVPALEIKCSRNEDQTQTIFSLPTTDTLNTPWTFLIVQVWREGDVYAPTEMTFMSVMDVIGNKVITQIDEHSDELLSEVLSHNTEDLKTLVESDLLKTFGGNIPEIQITHIAMYKKDGADGLNQWQLVRNPSSKKDHDINAITNKQNKV